MTSHAKLCAQNKFITTEDNMVDQKDPTLVIFTTTNVSSNKFSIEYNNVSRV